MGLTSVNHNIRKGLLIDKLLRGFKEHEYVWIAWKVASTKLTKITNDAKRFF